MTTGDQGSRDLLGVSSSFGKTSVYRSATYSSAEALVLSAAATFVATLLVEGIAEAELTVRGYTEREQSKCRQWVKLSLNSIASLEGCY